MEKTPDEIADFKSGWDCWVRFDRDYPAEPSPAFAAGYEAAAYDNDHGGGTRPELTAHDDGYTRYLSDEHLCKGGCGSRGYDDWDLGPPGYWCCDCIPKPSRVPQEWRIED